MTPLKARLNYSINMKNILSIFVLIVAISCSKQSDTTTAPPVQTQPAPVPVAKYTIETSTITGINIPNITGPQIQTGVNGAISGTILYSKDNVLNLVIPATLFFNYPLIPAIHLIKTNNRWQFENSYAEGAMGAGRNYECIDSVNQTWMYADHGLELSSGIWPNGDIIMMKTNGTKLDFTKISLAKSFYHSISTGDLNNDGLKDVIGLNMGTKGNWYNNLHPYMQNKDGSFSENRNLIVMNSMGGRGAGAVLIKDVFGDSRPEIIRADYGFNGTYSKPEDRYSIMIFSYNTATNNYTLAKDPGPIGVFSNNDRGSTSMKAADFNKDGFLDLAIATEGNNFNGIEIWMNDGKGNYTPSNQKLEYSFNQLQFREFEVYDYDKDGYPDIFLNPWAGKLFKDANTIYMDNLLWKNSGGNFGPIQKGITIPNVNTTFMKVFYINNQILYIGLQGNLDGSITLIEIVPNY